MGSYVLILMMHVGMMGSGNSNALTTVEFINKERCEFARKKAEDMAGGTVKVIKGVCVGK